MDASLVWSSGLFEAKEATRCIRRSILEARRQPHAYINAVETAKPKPIARSILEQLKVGWSPA